MKKNQISENEMVEFINANINSVPNRSKEKFTTYDIKTQYNKIKWYLKVQEMKNSEKNENVIVARLRRIFDVKNADVVFTDSFHGTIFSTIFERPFNIQAFC